MYSIQQVAKAMRMATFDNSPQWSLGELIEELSEINAEDDCWVSFAFGGFVPTTCHSWRGSYSEIAIGFTELDWEKRPRLSEFLKHLRECVGKTFQGYKGGDFTMDEFTPVWVANYGDSGQSGVVGLKPEFGASGKAYRVYIRTDYCEF